MSKRYEEKERAGELHSEFKRIEDKSKLKVEKQQQEEEDTTGDRGRRRNRDAGEEDGQDGAQNGEVCCYLLIYFCNRLTSAHLLHAKTKFSQICWHLPIQVQWKVNVTFDNIW